MKPKIQVHTSRPKVRVQNMRATVIYVHQEDETGSDGEPLGMVTNDNGRVDHLRVVGANMWRWEKWGSGFENAIIEDGAFPSAEEALAALMEELGLP